MVNNRPTGRASDGGVTLIEMLVVLVLIGISASVVTLALPSQNASRSVSQEAELLAARLNLAAERSLIEGRSFRMEWTTDTYAFSELSQDEWLPSGSETLPAHHALGADATMAGPSGARRGEIVIDPDLLPPATGAVELVLTSGTVRRSLVFDGVRARAGGDI